MIRKLNLKLKILEFFKTSENIYPITQNNIPEEINLQQHRCGELKYRKIKHFVRAPYVSNADDVYGVNKVALGMVFVFRSFVIGKPLATCFNLIYPVNISPYYKPFSWKKKLYLVWIHIIHGSYTNTIETDHHGGRNALFSADVSL
jgi:hypothetical protein